MEIWTTLQEEPKKLKRWYTERWHRDLVYCDPPYTHTQAILYDAQEFSLKKLLQVIDRCKRRGVFVALSIDGTKRSGNKICDLPIPDGLFDRELLIN